MAIRAEISLNCKKETTKVTEQGGWTSHGI
jgi:hypothetical protein